MTDDDAIRDAIRTLQLATARERQQRARERRQRVETARVERARATHEVMAQARRDRSEEPEEPGEPLSLEENPKP